MAASDWCSSSWKSWDWLLRLLASVEARAARADCLADRLVGVILARFAGVHCCSSTIVVVSGIFNGCRLTTSISSSVTEKRKI